jgi:hypothetical protein
MTDDAAHERRRVIIRRLEAEALEAVRAVPRPAYLMAEAVLALADDYACGRRQPDPRTRAIARAISAHADRINRQH